MTALPARQAFLSGVVGFNRPTRALAMYASSAQAPGGTVANANQMLA